ncbi:urease accessory UreF family protein [Pelagicoccus enzymogenes]|uniref:urease accessory protein UreF n=1 Tax=Pelagicoccus enzymogenes TaxID=2773457 RepID=UPI00280F7269|nr:urease accessory UreF family protein [Pelagicoccus enzymogenes]MDQ8199981.1 urease accessory UreF family protein [Pelagicoccus enzymogenes]
MNLPWLPSMLQTTDPLFPIGSYAHSYGLEELCATGDVCDGESLLRYLKTVVYLNLQEFELPYLRFLYESASKPDPEMICELDAEIGASKPSKELRNASSAQGQQRLRLISKLRPTPLFETLQELKNVKRLTPHHLTVFAAENVDLGTPLEPTLAAWAYQTLAAPCAASLKLIRIGQEGAQSVLTSALQDIEMLVSKSLPVERDFAGAFLPNLDIASQRHEQAFSRLFIS